MRLCLSYRFTCASQIALYKKNIIDDSPLRIPVDTLKRLSELLLMFGSTSCALNEVARVFQFDGGWGFNVFFREKRNGSVLK